MFFWDRLGKVLVYIVTHRGIEVNPNQIKAINKLQPPRNLKEVQKLTRMTAALNRFISRSANRCRPFFLLLHKWKRFEWTEECAIAFQQLKEYLSQPPIMSSPVMDEDFFCLLGSGLLRYKFCSDTSRQWCIKVSLLREQVT